MGGGWSRCGWVVFGGEALEFGEFGAVDGACMVSRVRGW